MGMLEKDKDMPGRLENPSRPAMGMREDFEKLADWAGWNLEKNGLGDYVFQVTSDAWNFYRVASLAAAEKVKEEAAKVCDSRGKTYEPHITVNAQNAHRKIGEAIRAIDVKKLLEHNTE